MRKDEDLLNDCLVSEKLLCSTLSTAVTEAATPKVRQEFQSALTNSFCTQNDLFQEMSSKGWYKTEAAQQNKITEAQSKFSNKPMQ
ncbi:MAG: spore coat protein [Vallitalea sp.]|jgi:spore coat protein CotF|nr:spore coat protein [Vallitalea sp.]